MQDNPKFQTPHFLAPPWLAAKCPPPCISCSSSSLKFGCFILTIEILKRSPKREVFQEILGAFLRPTRFLSLCFLTFPGARSSRNNTSHKLRVSPRSALTSFPTLGNSQGLHSSRLELDTTHLLRMEARYRETWGSACVEPSDMRPALFVVLSRSDCQNAFSFDSTATINVAHLNALPVLAPKEQVHRRRRSCPHWESGRRDWK